MAGSRWRNWGEAGLLEVSDLKQSDLLNRLHPPVHPLAGRGTRRVHATKDIRLPTAALTGCSIVTRNGETEDASSTNVAWGSSDPRSLSVNHPSMPGGVSDQLLMASGRARSVQSRICRQPGGVRLHMRRTTPAPQHTSDVQCTQHYAVPHVEISSRRNKANVTRNGGEASRR